MQNTSIRRYGLEITTSTTDIYSKRFSPFTLHQNPDPFLIVTGASFGAYHAVNFAFRYPHQVGRVVALSGYYDIKRWTGGYSDDLVYFHNPLILSNMSMNRIDWRPCAALISF